MAEGKVDVIFTGLIRTPDLFKKSILELNELKKEKLINKILFSTWDYEIDKYPGIRDFLTENKVILIESKEPKIRGKGNIFCQMKSLEVGLKKAGKNLFILKTRADLYLNIDFIRDLIKNKETKLKITRHLPGGDIFKYKMWVPYFEISNPFHIADESFFGWKEDIALSINYEDYDGTYKIRGGAAHIQRHIHPFVSNYSVLRTFLEEHSNVGYPKDNRAYRVLRKITRNNKKMLDFLNYVMVSNRFRVLNKRFKEQGYIDALAAYYSILYSHFYVDYQGVDNEINNTSLFKRNKDPKFKVGDPQIRKNFSRDRVFVPTKGHIYAYDDLLLRNIFENPALQEDKFSRRLIKSISAFTSSFQ